MRRLMLALLVLLAPSSAAAIPVVDDCLEAAYLDRTAPTADRDLHWDYSFAGDPERCLIVRVGQSVRWQGNFGDHPLEGDEGDTPNPIDNHNQGLVTFSQPGLFGFRCFFHFEMRGAIWVLPAGAPVPATPSHALAIILFGGLLLVIGGFRLRSKLHTRRA